MKKKQFIMEGIGFIVLGIISVFSVTSIFVAVIFILAGVIIVVSNIIDKNS